jgi:hypothetical protein
VHIRKVYSALQTPSDEGRAVKRNSFFRQSSRAEPGKQSSGKSRGKKGFPLSAFRSLISEKHFPFSAHIYARKQKKAFPFIHPFLPIIAFFQPFIKKQVSV